jgi:hypothetical protein
MNEAKKQHPDLPDPATEALEEPPLHAAELEAEIGDSETWDEASEKPGNGLVHPIGSAEDL